MNSIHPTAIVAGDVTMGVDNTLGAHSVVIGPVSLGNRNWIGTGVVIGAPPEVRSWEHPRDAREPQSGNGILIGDDNIFREYAQIHQGWQRETRVGHRGFIMNQVYVAHDCQVADDVTIAAHTSLAGHVVVGSGANLGMGVAVHQGLTISDLAMVGMNSSVTRDLPPFSKSWGSPARVRGLNVVGLRRAEFGEEIFALISAAYSSGAPREESLEALREFDALEPALRSWFTRTRRI